jgi:hypothetical protein
VEESKGGLKASRLAPAGAPVDLLQECLELVNVHADLVTVEPVAIPLACQSVAEEPTGISGSLVKTMAASLRILARPERLKDLVAQRAFAPERKEGDQLKRAGA